MGEGSPGPFPYPCPMTNAFDVEGSETETGTETGMETDSEAGAEAGTDTGTGTQQAGAQSPRSQILAPLSKNGGTDADHGGALGNRHLEVEAHAHRQLRQCAAEAVGEPVAQLAQGAEVGT